MPTLPWLRAQFLPYFLQPGVLKRTLFMVLSEDGNLARTVFTILFEKRRSETYIFFFTILSEKANLGRIILFEHGAPARTVFITFHA